MMGMPPGTAEVFNMLLWAVISMAAAATLNFRFWPMALFYGGTFVYSANYPEHRYLAMAAATIGFVIIGIWIWKAPASAKDHVED